jgi:hypothetical protein
MKAGAAIGAEAGRHNEMVNPSLIGRPELGHEL